MTQDWSLPGTKPCFRLDSCVSARDISSGAARRSADHPNSIRATAPIDRPSFEINQLEDISDVVEAAARIFVMGDWR